MSNATPSANALKIAQIQAALAAKEGEAVAPTTTLTDSILNTVGRAAHWTNEKASPQALKTTGVSAWEKVKLGYYNRAAEQAGVDITKL